MPEYFFTVFAAAAALCMGSFATALAYRLPRGQSIIKKYHSSCPQCGHDLSVMDLIPLFSWVFLRGRCRYCRQPIGVRYPVIEIVTALLCYAAYFVCGAVWASVFLFCLMPVVVAIIDIDLEYKIIPDALNTAIFLIGVAAFLVWAADMDSETVMAQAVQCLGGAVGYMVFAFLLRGVFSAALKREVMGLGDVKLFGAVGFWFGLGPDRMAGFMITSGILGIILGAAWHKFRGEKEFPFGPALVLAFVIILLQSRPPFLGG